jgi:hypothetical protein
MVSAEAGRVADTSRNPAAAVRVAERRVKRGLGFIGLLKWKSWLGVAVASPHEN